MASTGIAQRKTGRVFCTALRRLSGPPCAGVNAGTHAPASALSACAALLLCFEACTERRAPEHFAQTGHDAAADGGIGEGDWSDTTIVADQVTIKFQLVAVK
jgi:hypothetical protein